MTLLLALLLLVGGTLLAVAWSVCNIQRRLNLHFQPWLEVLEDRTVLDTYYWTGAGANAPGGNALWSNPKNWWDDNTNTNAVPGTNTGPITNSNQRSIVFFASSTHDPDQPTPKTTNITIDKGLLVLK